MWTAALKVLDYPYTPEGHMLFNFGKAGAQYDMKDGYPKWRDEIVKPPEVAVGAEHRPTCPQQLRRAVCARHSLSGAIFCPPRAEEAYETWGDADHGRIMPPVTPTQEESREYAKMMTEVNARLKEVFAKVVTGAEPIEAWDTFVAEMKSVGIEEAVGIQQAALERIGTEVETRIA